VEDRIQGSVLRLRIWRSGTQTAQMPRLRSAVHDLFMICEEAEARQNGKQSLGSAKGLSGPPHSELDKLTESREHLEQEGHGCARQDAWNKRHDSEH
jgi:hypothetical protein